MLFSIVLKQLYHFALTFWISVITLSLANVFTSYSHTMLLRSRHVTRGIDLQMTLIFNKTAEVNKQLKQTSK